MTRLIFLVVDATSSKVAQQVETDATVRTERSRWCKFVGSARAFGILFRVVECPRFVPPQDYCFETAIENSSYT